MSGPRISLVVPAHRDGPELDEALRAMAVLDPPPHEKILVDDGPLDGAAARAAGAGFVLVCAGPGRGAAAARNAGARRATGDVVLFADSDVLVPCDLVARIAACFVRDPGLTAVFGSYDDAPAHPSTVSRYRNLLHHFVHQESRPEATTFWGACGAVRRQAFADVGGFDESYPDSSIEDIEIGGRLCAAGATIRLERDIQVKHLKGWTLAGFLWTDLFRRALPWTRLMLAGGHLTRDLNLGIRHRLGFAASAGVALGLAGGTVWTEALLLVPLALGAFVAVHARFFAWLARRGGAAFGVAAVPLHLLHSLAACAGFAFGLAAHLLTGAPASARPPIGAPTRTTVPTRLGPRP